MNRFLLYPFAGVAIGVLAAVVIVPIIGGAAHDTAAITLFVGTFLAGSGAITGALIGLADLLLRTDRTRLTRDHDGS
ncbi:MAG: hypothetical protein Q8K78_00205 [Planctomycetaceae bacterium]|jgi:hypothetical protein|nr:hypothetical protein [Planctomycetaceae bacterium]